MFALVLVAALVAATSITTEAGPTITAVPPPTFTYTPSVPTTPPRVVPQDLVNRADDPCYDVCFGIAFVMSQYCKGDTSKDISSQLQGNMCWRACQFRGEIDSCLSCARSNNLPKLAASMERDAALLNSVCASPQHTHVCSLQCEDAERYATRVRNCHYLVPHCDASLCSGTTVSAAFFNCGSCLNTARYPLNMHSALDKEYSTWTSKCKTYASRVSQWSSRSVALAMSSSRSISSESSASASSRSAASASSASAASALTRNAAQTDAPGGLLAAAALVGALAL